MKKVVMYKCDICGAHLSARQDDNAESFKNRFNIYINNVNMWICIW